MKLPFLSLLTVAALTLSGCMAAKDAPQAKTSPQAKHDHGPDHKHDDHATRDDHTKPDAHHATPADDAVKAEREKLSPEDRKLVDAQEWCVISNGNRLGVMGAPIKVMVKDQPVFLCCAGCKDAALKDADKTLAKLEELKAKKKEAKPADGHDHGKDGHAHAGHHGEASEADIKAAREKLSAEDRALVEAQEWCAVMPEDRLGCMGAPVKITIKGQTVLLCCKGCEKDALADPDKTLAKVEEMKAKKKAAGGK
jgi:hypothetical protein